ncbi:ABC transporter ATP-binding protein [Streptomyces laculatispora]|uniref:ABC transporter ATP-binding protein n=1 Tax=Streptomyces laculatispora TaxID=887464 RepID=UPI001A944DE6|nr:ABC transporter ATP-binding protein [Streptomyces laculatispora]MBO0918198.1 ABC transporter ATP-binding protein [Streptomyces laculatispora]
MSAVAVEGLLKKYGDHEAVSGVDFSVEEGEIFALLGPNGAGKTTTMEILEGFRERDGGSVRVLGRDPGTKADGRWLRGQIGLVLQDIAIEPYLTVRESVARNAGYYPAPRGTDEVIDLVGLGEKRDAKVKDLSGGQKRRLDLALGVVGDPQLLFLDEPTTGFDPNARRGAWEVVRNLRDAGTTILLTTHYMDEAQELADSVAVIAGGKIVAAGTPDTLGGRDSALARIRFALPRGAAIADVPLAVTDAEDGLVTAEAEEPTAALHRLTSWALDRGTPLERLTVEQPTLEDIYLGLTSSYAQQDASSPSADRGRTPSPERRGRRPGRSRR